MKHNLSLFDVCLCRSYDPPNSAGHSSTALKDGPMKITNVVCQMVTIPYKNPYRMAPGETRHKRQILVLVETDEGITGVGETGVTLIERGGETQEAIYITIKKYFTPLVIGMDPFEIGRVIDKLETFNQGRTGFLCAKAAIDTALYDIMGKATNRPVAAVLGGIYRTKFRVSRSLGVKTPTEMGQDALKLKNAGYAMLTVKCGFDPKEDVERVAAVRDAVGRNYPIEVDINGAYTAEIAIPTLKKMERYEIEAVEQPVAWWDLKGMREVRVAIDTPVTADESAVTPLRRCQHRKGGRRRHHMFEAGEEWRPVPVQAHGRDRGCPRLGRADGQQASAEPGHVGPDQFRRSDPRDARCPRLWLADGAAGGRHLRSAHRHGSRRHGVAAARRRLRRERFGREAQEVSRRVDVLIVAAHVRHKSRSASNARRGCRAMRSLCCVLLALLAPLTRCDALAQGFPDRPIRMIVGFPPGGAADIVARILAQRLAGPWGQQNGRGQPPRRGQHARVRDRGQIGAGRLHAADDLEQLRRERRAVPDQLRPGRVFRAGHAGCLGAAGADRQSIAACKVDKRSDRARPGKAEGAQLRIRRQRQHHASRRGAFQPDERRQHRARALQRRRASADRISSAGRYSSLFSRSRPRAARQERQGAWRSRSLRRSAHPRCPRYPPSARRSAATRRRNWYGVLAPKASRNRSSASSTPTS
jgi:hypothetical protein